MTTVINNPGDSSGSTAGIIIGIVVVVVLGVLFFVYGLPAIRNSGAPPGNNSIDLNVKLPAGENSASN